MAVLSGPHPTVEGVLDWLSVSLAKGREGHVGDAVRAFAATLDGPPTDAAGELLRLADGFAGRLRVVRPHLGVGAGFRDLLPDAALERLAGEELLIAAIVVAVGQRAGMDVQVVVGERRAVVGHTGLPIPSVIAPHLEGRIIDAADLRETLWYAEPVDVARSLLARVDQRAALLGDLPMRIAAHEHQLELPLDRTERARCHVELARARSSLN